MITTERQINSNLTELPNVQLDSYKVNSLYRSIKAYLFSSCKVALILKTFQGTVFENS